MLIARSCLIHGHARASLTVSAMQADFFPLKENHLIQFTRVLTRDPIVRPPAHERPYYANM